MLNQVLYNSSIDASSTAQVVTAAVENSYPGYAIFNKFTPTSGLFAGTVKLQESVNNTDWVDIASATQAFSAATATLNLTEDIILYSSTASTARNDGTFTIQVEAAAANPTDTVLVTFSGTSAAITVTVRPNDGTNNEATAVGLTTAELVELINTGAVDGKNITLTDTSSLRALQNATGGDTTELADSGEGDGVAATFASGASDGFKQFLSGANMFHSRYIQAHITVSTGVGTVYSFISAKRLSGDN